MGQFCPLVQIGLKGLLIRQRVTQILEQRQKHVCVYDVRVGDQKKALNCPKSGQQNTQSFENFNKNHVSEVHCMLKRQFYVELTLVSLLSLMQNYRQKYIFSEFRPFYNSIKNTNLYYILTLYLDRFKSKRTLQFWTFLDSVQSFEGNSKLADHSILKI